MRLLLSPVSPTWDRGWLGFCSLAQGRAHSRPFVGAVILRDPMESWAWLSTAETSSAPHSTQDSACSWGVAEVPMVAPSVTPTPGGGSPPGLPGLVRDKTSCFPRADSTDPPSSLWRLLLSPSPCNCYDNYASHGEGDCPARKWWVELGWDGSDSDSSFPAPLIGHSANLGWSWHTFQGKCTLTVTPAHV